MPSQPPPEDEPQGSPEEEASEEDSRDLRAHLEETLGALLDVANALLQKTPHNDRDERKNALAFCRVVAALATAYQDDDGEGLEELGTPARAYLRRRSGGLGLIDDDDERTLVVFDVELPRPTVAQTLRKRLTRHLSVSTNGTPAEVARYLSITFWGWLGHLPSELDGDLEAAGVTRHGHFPEDSAHQERVVTAFEAKLTSIARDEWATPETAECLITEALVALGISRSSARGLFDYERKAASRKEKRNRKPSPEEK